MVVGQHSGGQRESVVKWTAEDYIISIIMSHE